ncbi:MAG: UDP-N-acetylglucosamine 1-carboxyvinyltransferase [Planctomycetota bacterium]|nr:UDP-N-acetylglucosamine 1-carboxyvinyltransferase [Planctomycetota bacterium]
MDAFVITGGSRLRGRVAVNGSKNAALPQMAAALLTDQPVTLHAVPGLADTRSMAALLAQLGCAVDELDDRAEPGRERPLDLMRRALDRRVRIRAEDETASHARYDIVRTMRASICVLGPLLARRGEARISMPGGCAIGDRPVDLHLRGLAALGAEISLSSGDIVARAPGHAKGRPGRLIGGRVFLGGPFGSTVLGTANIMCAATLARGTTIIESAACEPEVVDLATLLLSMGARIRGAGTPRIIIEGVDSLGGAEHTVIPDRIEAGTFMMAAAITNGSLTIENCPLDAMMAVTDRLESIGVQVQPVDPAAFEADPMRAACEVSCRRALSPVQVTTQPHPGFPTDLQAQLMSLLCLADGNSVVTEKIYPERFLHVAELSRMGARLFRQGPTVIVSGVRSLVGAPVMASDLRASAGLVLAGLAAEGTTVIRRVYHLDRGYERLERILQALGADIRRVDDRELDDAAAPSESAPREPGLEPVAPARF